MKDKNKSQTIIERETFELNYIEQQKNEIVKIKQITKATPVDLYSIENCHSLQKRNRPKIKQV